MSTKNTKAQFYYFGCIGETGHYLFPAPGSDRIYAHELPWGNQIDSGLCPTGRQIEGQALLHHKGGWTALSFWDCSVDTRPGSNSNFISNEALTFSEMLNMAGMFFPNVLGRLKFAIALSALTKENAHGK